MSNPLLEILLGPAVAFLGLLAIGILLALGEAWASWRRVPLQQKSHSRAGLGAFGLVALAIYSVKRGFSEMGEVELFCVAGLAAFSALWLGVGVAGSQGALRFDPMSVFWFGVAFLGAVALLIKGMPL